MRITLQATGALGIASTISAAIIGWAYYQKSGDYDPSVVAEFKHGGMVLDSDFEMIGSLADDGRILVRREEIPDHLVAALVTAEDTRFYEHPGFDALGIVRAALANLENKGINQGGSTITQQLARNSSDLGGRTLDRKLVELFFSLRIEEEFTKDEIVTHYLNRIYFGSGFHGVGAAAVGYFGKKVDELSVAESAMLCGLISRPNALSPFNNPEGAQASKERVLDRMVAMGYLDPESAANPDFRVVKVAPNDGRNNRPRFLLSLIRKEARQVMGDRPFSGIIVETSLNTGLQKVGESILSEKLTDIESFEGLDYPHPTRGDYQSGLMDDPDYLQGAAVVIENSTGRIMAAVCSRDPFESEYDRVTMSRRSAGTAFFPFVYAAAYESGAATPLSDSYDVPIDNRQAMMGGQSGILGDWGAESIGRKHLGTVPSGYALIAGTNAATLRLGFQTGLGEVKALARRAGIRSPLPDFPSAFLGAGEVSLLELTHAYTTFPNKGWRSGRAGLIDRITTRDGEVIYEEPNADDIPARAFSEQTAEQVLPLLFQAVHEKARAETAAQLASLRTPVGGMTGTSCEFKDNWFVGFNGRYTWGVWIGMDRPQPIYKNAFARDTALPVWSRFATILDPPEPSLALAGDGDLIPICVDSGCLARVGCGAHGHRLIGFPPSSEMASLDYCRVNEPPKDPPGFARMASLPAEPGLPAIPVSLPASNPPRSDVFKPVSTETPPLVGENIYSILDELVARRKELPFSTFPLPSRQGPLVWGG